MDVPIKLASTTRPIGVAGRTCSFMDGSLGRSFRRLPCYKGQSATRCQRDLRAAPSVAGGRENEKGLRRDRRKPLCWIVPKRGLESPLPLALAGVGQARRARSTLAHVPLACRPEWRKGSGVLLA